MERIGFIGLGIMGRPMAGHILQAGYPMHVYNRSGGKAAELEKGGAVVASTPAEVAKACDIIITIVSDTPDVENVLFGKDGLAQGLSAGKVVVDMSTISAEATRGFSARIAELGAVMLDAPVSGGDIGAINAKLSIMVGGDKAAFERCVPVFRTMGTKITYMGPSGAGQATKMANQVMVLACMMGVAEGLMLGSKEGLDLDALVEVVSGGAGASAQLTLNGTKMVKRDFSPGFFTDLAVKDLGIVQDAQNSHRLASPCVALSLQFLRALQAEEDGGRLGTQAVLKVYEKLSNYSI
ncbi:MAG: NAD(P)-dependent oxidoreductase [Defluviitaleaceae bacterium]|nr:NAD(P)-dependent oxidoreductase [Defluviitaleaceae bacterium]